MCMADRQQAPVSRTGTFLFRLQASCGVLTLARVAWRRDDGAGVPCTLRSVGGVAGVAGWRKP
jgi:hypothetical protein